MITKITKTATTPVLPLPLSAISSVPPQIVYKVRGAIQQIAILCRDLSKCGEDFTRCHVRVLASGLPDVRGVNGFMAQMLEK